MKRNALRAINKTESKIVLLIGGSDLFFGMRGLSKGTKIISKAIHPYFDKVLTISYNYFLDFGRSLAQLSKFIDMVSPQSKIYLYGYSKGGDVALRLARQLENKRLIELLITIDIANGPWSHKINRSIPSNVIRNINVFQSTPGYPLGSYGLPAHSKANTVIENIDVTGSTIDGVKVSHRSIERLMAHNIITWLTGNNIFNYHHTYKKL